MDIAWKDHNLQQLKIFSKFGNPLKIRYRTTLINLATRSGTRYGFDSEMKLVP